MPAAADRGRAKVRRVPKAMVGSPLARNLTSLARMPDGRDCTQPSFGKTAEWVAGRLKAQGVKPLGTGRSGIGRFFQGFRWHDTKGEKVTSFNIVGLREGSGKHREAVIVMAHLDGITAREKQAEGVRRYQGANDNATGVAGVLQISETLARMERRFGKRFKRDIIFVITSGEERGNIGAEAFVKFHNKLGGRKIVGAINLDSIGWGKLDEVGLYGGTDAKAARKNPVFRAGMALRPKGKMARVYAGHKGAKNYFKDSDHYALAAAGIPSVLYAGKVTDMMHTSRDTLGRLQLGTVKGTSRHALRLLIGLANDRRLDGKGKTLPQKKLQNFSPWGPLYRADVDRARRALRQRDGSAD
jgi:hypothetical protein